MVCIVRHRKEGMVNVKNRTSCQELECTILPSFNLPEQK
jgi:hypothetical protein